MAGAGYKLFNTGDVLTAAQVNTFLMEQTVMVFNDATARTAALSGVVAEGMLSYLKSTKQVEVYNGTAWVASDDPNAIQNTIVDAKGDLITATAADVPARLAVGANGETLVADSSTSTGLRWQGNFAAGKNKIINGDFNIWQRGTSFTPSAAADNQIGADRFINYWDGTGTTTFSRQSFTPGSAPVSGYEGNFYLRSAMSSGATLLALGQRIEDVRTFAGQTATLSFWARATSSVVMNGMVRQNFGSGGSAVVDTFSSSGVTLTSSWVRYSFTFSVPSVSGKTIGSNSFLQVYPMIYSSGTIASNTIDIWGVQVETGSVATAFQTATGTLAGELAACQRYYERFGQTIQVTLFNSVCYSTIETYGTLPYVQKRITPTVSISNTGNFVIVIAGASRTPTASGAAYISNKAARIQFNTTGLTAGQAAWIETDATTNGFIEVNAEL